MPAPRTAHPAAQHAALAAAFAAALALGAAPGTAHAQTAAPKIKVGLMLPATGTFAALGTAIENGFRLHVAEQGGKLAGREIEYVRVDDESDPAKATDNVNKLVKRDNVDVLVGTVHSGVAMAMAKVAKDSGTILIVPNAGADAVTGPMCGPTIFRSSFSNWQPGYAMGEVVARKGHKSVVRITWKYAAGDEAFEGFRDSYTKAGGTIIKELGLPFPNVEFQALLTEIASLKPDAVACFFAGAGAAKFIRDYAAAGLKGKIPLYGSGFLTEGVLDAAGPAAEGILTTLHYSDSLDTKRNQDFRRAFAIRNKLQPDVYAVQGYDSGLLLAQGLNAVKGDFANKKALYAAMEGATIDSPRGKWTMSKAHNPIQDMYLREVKDKENKVIGIAAKQLADPATGCRMA